MVNKNDANCEDVGEDHRDEAEKASVQKELKKMKIVLTSTLEAFHGVELPKKKNKKKG